MTQGESLQLIHSRLEVFRNTPFGIDAWSSVGEPARYTGRFHRKGDPLPLYASSSGFAALRELELHTEEPLEPSRDVLRRITAVGIAAGPQILIADHEDTLSAVGVTLDDIYDSSRYDACHAVTEYARSVPNTVAISTQSNAARTRRTVAILPEHADRITGLVDYWEGSLNLLQALFSEPALATQISQ